MAIERNDLVSLRQNALAGNLDQINKNIDDIRNSNRNDEDLMNQTNNIQTAFNKEVSDPTENQNLLQKFFEFIFGPEKKEKYDIGTYEEFLVAATDGQAVELTEVEGESPALSEGYHLPNDKNGLLGYKDKFSELTKEIEAFNGKSFDDVLFQQEGDKLKVVLPKELYDIYNGVSVSDEERTAISNGLREFIASARKKVGESLLPGSDTPNTQDTRPITDRIGDADFDKLKQLRNGEDFAISGRRQREALRGNRSYSIGDEEKEYNRYQDAIAREKSENGHFNQEIGGKNKLIQRWSDKYPESGVDFKAFLGHDSRFDAIDVGDRDQGIGKLYAENKDLKGLVDERNSLAGKRDKRIEKFKNVATNQLNYARAKTMEQYHQVGYDSGAKDLEKSVIEQGNLAHYFSASKHSDVLGSVAKEIANLAPDKENGMSANGLKECVETAYSNMSDEAKASMHKVDIFKVKLDSKTLGAGKQVLAYAQAMPKVFSAMLSEKVGGELGQEGHPIVDALDKMREHSAKLGQAKKDREKKRSEETFKDRGNIATRTAQSVSDSMAEFSSGVSNNSKIASQKTWNAGVTAVHAAEEFAKAVDNKIDEIGRAAERFSESVDRGVTNAIDSASNFAHEKSGGKFHKLIEEEKGAILDKLKGDKSVGDDSSVSTTDLSRESSVLPDARTKTPRGGQGGGR
ncbi:MAG: hypothetical protein ISQ34_03220 [Rickettsiales bacterium]|nr:hypothetical protein [Rickettsiales bacterium]